MPSSDGINFRLKARHDNMTNAFADIVTGNTEPVYYQKKRDEITAFFMTELGYLPKAIFLSDFKLAGSHLSYELTLQQVWRISRHLEVKTLKNMTTIILEYGDFFEKSNSFYESYELHYQEQKYAHIRRCIGPRVWCENREVLKRHKIQLTTWEAGFYESTGRTSKPTGPQQAKCAQIVARLGRLNFR